jgi:2-polyprenyl-3-methyl-5-hydroxy-6-metoxy-1,4-benzoquinol methylase
VFLKVFNNFIKKSLINKFVFHIKKNLFFRDELSVLDLCCGRGGDLLKWRNEGIAHYVGVDLSESLISEAKKRYMESIVHGSSQHTHRGFNQKKIFKAVFMVNDAGDKDNLVDKLLKQEKILDDIREEIRFDIVST